MLAVRVRRNDPAGARVSAKDEIDARFQRRSFAEIDGVTEDSNLFNCRDALENLAELGAAAVIDHDNGRDAACGDCLNGRGKRSVWTVCRDENHNELAPRSLARARFRSQRRKIHWLPKPGRRWPLPRRRPCYWSRSPCVPHRRERRKNPASRAPSAPRKRWEVSPARTATTGQPSYPQ